MKKIISIAILLLLMFANCRDRDVENAIGKNQVYYDRHGGREETPFLETCDVVGKPSIIIYDGQIPSATAGHPTNNYPFTISGKIDEGNMKITFPNKSFSLDSNYECKVVGSIKIATINLRQKDNGMNVFALHKWTNNVWGRIYIYYVDNEYAKLNDGAITLKKGWNYIEFINDYDNNIFQKAGKISQDINDFIKEGYRWTLEIWI